MMETPRRLSGCFSRAGASMDRRRAVASGLGLAVAIAAGRAQAALPADVIGQIETYLNGFSTLQANFEQIDNSGNVDRGEVFMRRPGELRFDYAPPSRVLLVASDWRLIFYDGRTQQANTLPLRETPLGILLDENIRLRGPVTIGEIAEVNGEAHVTVFKTDQPEIGSITLIFGLSPVELRRWEVIDAQGDRTQVILNGIQTNVALDDTLFRWNPAVYGLPDD